MTATAPVRFNPFGADFRRDPYPQYRALREADPVHRTLGMWVLTRHADVTTVLRDRTYGAGLIPQLVERQAQRLHGRADVTAEGVARIARLARTSLVFTDDPDHARLRGLVNRVFTAAAVAELRPRVDAIVEDLLHPVAGEVTDAVADLAAPLPVRVLSDWMALPPDLAARVGSWTHDIRFLLEPGLMGPDELARACEVVETFGDALGGIVAERRRAPGEDLLSRLTAAGTAAGDRLGDEEVVFVGIMCFVAGTETTTALVANGLLALLGHPEQAELLHRRPELARGAVGEVLRYDGPLQLTKRLATRDLDIDGRSVTAGDQILLCLGAANRDPAVFDAPNDFDITRDPRRHLAFGHGMHGCLGGALAELQAEVALARLVGGPLCPRLAADDVTWQDRSMIVRGPTAVPVRWGSTP